MATLGKAMLISLLVWLAMVAGLTVLFVPHGGVAPVPPAIDDEVRGTLVALGDSYISGEGADAFESGTDVPGGNQCRRAATAYPWAVAEALELHLVFAACSGAETFNVGYGVPVPGTPETPVPDEPLQRLTLERHQDAEVVLLSIGGNDARFAEIIKYCMGVGESCVALAQDWMDNLTVVMQPRLRSTYAAVRAAAPSAIVYVVGYPSPFDESLEECARVGLTSSEVQFLRRFTTRLNDEVALAAETQRFRVVLPDAEFSSRAICSEETAPPTLREWHPQWPPRVPRQPMDVLRGSFHPTPAGHAILADQLIPQLQLELRDRTPPPMVEPGVPPIPPAPPVPPTGPTPPGSPPAPGSPPFPPDLPPILADDLVPPGAPIELGTNPCSPVAESQSYASLTGSAYPLSGLQPESTVCLRREFEPWQTQRADAAGRALLDFGRTPTAGIQGWRSVILQDSDGRWRSLYLSPPDTAPPPELPLWRAWVTSPSGLALVAGVVLLFVATVVVVRTLLGLSERGDR